jgi:hypothetical protein
VAAPAFERLRRILPKSALGWVHVATSAVSWFIILAMIAAVMAPTLTDVNTIGGHDWDQQESYRYFVTKAVLRFHQFPFWNPYACGGYPSWGGFESDTTVVSPWFPFYLTMPLGHAMRIEMTGMMLLAAAGAWLLAGRFTLSPSARALVVVAFAANSRWTLQASSGHTWHLAYAWTPWALYFYDRAVGADRAWGRPRYRDVVLTGACLAVMVYMGGIYPLPHTLVAITLYGLFLAAVMRSYRPIVVELMSGLVALGLSAPKLLPVLDVIRRYPRLVDSPESIDLGTFVKIFTSRERVPVSPWGWHEFGIYVGWPVVIVVMIAALFGRGARESPLKWTGCVLLLLGFGSFDPHAPWPLLHHLPIFKSQHVPSRWLYPGLLLLMVLSAAVLERILRRTGRARGWLEIAIVGATAWISRDIAQVAREPMSAFTNHMPAIPESSGPFHTEIHAPPELEKGYARDWAPPALPAEIANIGTIDCGVFPGFHNYYRDTNGRTFGLGARGRGDPAYHGEAFIAEGVGQAAITSFTPNRVTVEVSGATPGEHVVLNQNWDAGWTANGSPVIDWADTSAAVLSAPQGTITFRYRPRFWYTGLALFAMTLAGIGFAYRHRRRFGSTANHETSS